MGTADFDIARENIDGFVEPDQFDEPGLFLIRLDQTLYYGSVQMTPFVRLSVRELVSALVSIIENE